MIVGFVRKELRRLVEPLRLIERLNESLEEIPRRLNNARGRVSMLPSIDEAFRRGVKLSDEIDFFVTLGRQLQLIQWQ